MVCDYAVVALLHVKVIDGTGEPGRPDQTLIIRDGKIAAVGDTSSTLTPPGAKVFDLAGHSVFPGLVGMHVCSAKTLSASQMHDCQCKVSFSYSPPSEQSGESRPCCAILSCHVRARLCSLA